MAEKKRILTGSVKLIAAVLAIVLVVGGVVGGTVAWLIAAPDPVVNTFTYGDINITLTETDTKLDGDDDVNTNQYKMLPGSEIKKDPLVTVIAGSESCWLFVELTESENFGGFMEYAVEGSWAKLDGQDNVYYRHIAAAEVAEENLEIHVLADDKVTVKEDVTKEMLNALDENADGSEIENPAYPTLTVTAYAVQSTGIDSAADAWAKINPPAENP